MPSTPEHSGAAPQDEVISQAWENHTLACQGRSRTVVVKQRRKARRERTQLTSEHVLHPCQNA